MICGVAATGELALPILLQIQLTSAISNICYFERFSVSPRFGIRVCIEKSSAILNPVISNIRYLEPFSISHEENLLFISNFAKFSAELDKETGWKYV